MRRYYIAIVCGDQRLFYAVCWDEDARFETFVPYEQDAFGYVYLHYCEYRRDLLARELKPELAETLTIVERRLSA